MNKVLSARSREKNKINWIWNDLNWCCWYHLNILPFPQAHSLHLFSQRSLFPLSVYGILQARILKWVAIPFSRGSSQPRDRTQVSHIAGRFFTSWATREAQEYWKERRKVRSHSRVQLFGTPWTVACQAPLSVEFSRQEYWSQLLFPSPGDLPDPRMKA